ncbi:hypothetical protein L486_07642 [Kwoniella mangroviensis CBS 10435]|uniref:Uncharacterized protein n=1 Tax=Kwoniella mangroviensis CBS 10435 TaxID=1331196 RepID=A0A1B9IH87_9TREE|nr:uncharacterized protein I203_03460 [Kwoniella mangroviensis CBS 8507]OCF54986.1 hypothetical protein L486_07642 [Kwoniella mangroviensis CBS 10435]OCF67762.1 hypothetical protein I203_03460 [Kwoniella mangroviensis CBS 8507]
MSDQAQRTATTAPNNTADSAGTANWPVDLSSSPRPRRTDAWDPHTFPSFQGAMSASAENELTLAIQWIRHLNAESSTLERDSPASVIHDNYWDLWKSIGDKSSETLSTAQARTANQEDLIEEWNTLFSESTVAEAYPMNEDEFAEQYRQLLQLDAERTERLASAANKDDDSKAV